MLNGRLDVAIVSWVEEPLPGLRSFVAVQERLAAAVRSAHHGATRASVRPAELLDVPVVCLALGTGVRAAYETMMSREGLPAPVTTSQADLPDDLVYVPVDSDCAGSRLGVVWRSGHAITAATRTVLDALRDNFDFPN